jgi:YebC/PmpR family DNA-binding regulatory protein
MLRGELIRRSVCVQRCLAMSRGFSCGTWLTSGHSKWSTIKHDKAKNDALRSKLSTKFSNMIVVATKDGGPDPSLNVRLAATIENALKCNVPKKVIEGAIKRGSGESSGPGESSVLALYEGIGPGGVAVVVEALTDNKNRTSQQVRAAFMKFAGTLSPTLYLFERRGWIELDKTVELDDQMFEFVVELGAEDVEEDNNGVVVVYTSPNNTSQVANGLKNNYKIANMGIEYASNPDTKISALDETRDTSLRKLIDTLEDLDDVTDVYTNYAK